MVEIFEFKMILSDLKMTFFDLFDDLEWPWYSRHWNQNRILNRIICVLCVVGRVSDLWPQNDLVWPLWWPRLTSRCTPLNSEANFQSNGMYIMCIWQYFRFSTQKWPFWPPSWPQMTSRCTPLNSEENFQSIHMHIMRIRHEICVISIFDLQWP